ncbi:MAG: HIT family hydrolase [Geobacteraceae bacterium GWC2_48_7]|nr:MAG: HIT family hydrolase [Geobacteraceae bacterium GWC2_48_7]
MKNECPMCSRWLDDADLQIAEFENSFAILNRDQFFQGYCLLFAKKHVTELFHLDQSERGGLMEELNLLASALDAVFSPAKINYELLGNMVPHMHWHIIPRFEHDPLWPRPIWSEPHQDVTLLPEEYCCRIELIRKALL